MQYLISFLKAVTSIIYYLKSCLFMATFFNMKGIAIFPVYTSKITALFREKNTPPQTRRITLPGRAFHCKHIA